MSSDPVHTREPTIPILHSAVGQEILSTKSRSEDDPKETPRPPNSALSLSIPRTCIVPHTKCRRQTRPSLYAVERCHGLFRPYYRSLCSTTAFSRKIDQMALSCPNRCIGPLLGNSRCHQGLMVFGAIQGNRSFQRQSKNGYTPSPLLAEELHPRTLTLSRKVVSHLQCHLSLLALCNR